MSRGRSTAGLSFGDMHVPRLLAALFVAVQMVATSGCSESNGSDCVSDDACKYNRVCVADECVYPDELEGDTGRTGTSGGDTEEQESDRDGSGQGTCSEAVDCPDDQTCVGPTNTTCEDYWACEGFGEGADSSGRCVTTWTCSEVDYSLSCPKNTSTGSRCQCIVDGQVERDFVFEGDGCRISDKHDFASFHCGWAVPAP